MKGSLTLVAAAAMLGITVASAFAQQQKAPVYRYCLLEAGGGWRGGGGPMLCRFNTYAQCAQSKNSFADSCIINPELTFRRR
jgi:hypothetical protein